MKPWTRNLLLFIGVPLLYALLVRLIATDDLFAVMSMTFLFLVPTVMGYLTIFFRFRGKKASLWERIFLPWLPVFAFLVITLAFGIEGWACWLMVLPLFLVAASVGGLVAGVVHGPGTNGPMQASLLALLPFLIGPVEQRIGPSEKVFQVDTHMDIQAPASVIWPHVTRVQAISEDEDSGRLNQALGFPRPVKAELDRESVGGYREAVFTNGLVFHETVTAYAHEQSMSFSIKSDPHEIPSTTLDEHVVIGGEFFDVLDGTYRLEDLGNGSQRLHLSSRFTLNTSFNFYAGRWAAWIMRDIQMNILRVQKRRSETGS